MAISRKPEKIYGLVWGVWLFNYLNKCGAMYIFFVPIKIAPNLCRQQKKLNIWINNSREALNPHPQKISQEKQERRQTNKKVLIFECHNLPKLFFIIFLFQKFNCERQFRSQVE